MSRTIHSVKHSQTHLLWDNSIPPVLRISSGETITFTCLDASNSQINKASTTETLHTLKFSLLGQLSGPVFIESATPGDVLQIEVLDINTADWGWTAIIPGFGILSDEFPAPKLKIWSIEPTAGFVWFNEEKGIKIPLAPFAGMMGVAQKRDGAFSTIPPYRTGGNLDVRWLGKGSILFLPVDVDGGLFSVGDGHAAQGDGEVCGTGIETPITITLRFTVIKGETRPYLQTPHFRTAPTTITGEQYYATTGVDPDMREATRNAVRHMISLLMHEFGLDREEAYMLCSVAGDLRLHEVVDMPNYVVGLMLPKSIFTRPGTAFEQIGYNM